jgi:hypothetical protein
MMEAARATWARPQRRAIWDSLDGAIGSLPAVALLIWAASLADIQPEKMGSTGLVSVLPIWTLLAFAAVNIGFVAAAARAQLDTRTLAAYLGALIVMLYATTALVEPQPAFEAAYRHVGIADYIGSAGTVDTRIDAYFNWPGFFALVASFTDAAGLRNGLSLVPWAPLFYNVLYLGPLVVIFRSLTSNRRVVWVAVWLFYLTNWTAQDYFSPQATSYFLYLVAIAVLLRWFTPPAEPVSPAQRVGLLAVAIAACAAVVPMHQLTPFALLASVTALVLWAGCTVRLLPVLLAVLIAAWMSYMTVGFLNGNLGHLLGTIGNLGGTVTTNVSNRIGGDAGHRLVVDARLLLTAALWVLAAAGWRLLPRRGRRPATVLALAPLPLLALQAYGGEMLIRVALFSLPFAAFLAATAVSAALTTGSRWRVAIAATGAVAMMVALLFARFGNEQMDAFSSGDVAGVRALYRIAPPGSQLIAVSGPVPWRTQDYNSYRYERLATRLPTIKDAPIVARPPLPLQLRDLMRAAAPRKSFLIVTRSQIDGDALLGTATTPARTVAAQLRASHIFDVAYANGDATIFTLNALGEAGGS